MSSHHASVRWARETPDFQYATYGRDHDVTFGGGGELRASAAPEYKGTASLPNPEELLVAALASCHMLTFLAVAARKGLVVDAYTDRAEGTLAKDTAGKLAITEVRLRPEVRFAAGGPAPDAATLRALHDTAHRGCFIASSVKTRVMIGDGPAHD